MGLRPRRSKPDASREKQHQSKNLKYIPGAELCNETCGQMCLTAGDLYSRVDSPGTLSRYSVTQGKMAMA